MNEIQNVLIAGGGVGGLAAAVAFAQRGAAVTLIERRPDFDVPGVGLGQPANALRVYDALGVLDEVLDVGFVYDHMSICDADGHMIVPHKFLLGDDRVPSVCALPRSDLHDILLRAAKKSGVTVRLGLHVTEIDQNRTDQASVVFADGSSGTFDLMAGFDGIRSTTRVQLFGTAFVPRYSGFGAWRLQVPRQASVTGMEFLQSTDGKVGAMPIGEDTMYLFNIRPEPDGVFFPKKDMARLWRERLAGFGSYVAEVRDQLNDKSDIVYSPIEPLLVPWPWHRGRVVIGGDAAHVVPPHLTQGAAMAVEDAYILALEMMSGEGTVEARLMRYARQRYGRCAFVYTFSSQWLELEQSIRTPGQMEAARRELALNGSNRIAASDRILNTKLF
jgi:2-polyprenyl-6-methoxyphenol hydroxylase-like FAD-dependent oxidoreductase